MKNRIAIIFGGKTVEHEVSIISALQAMSNMKEDKYEIVPIYIDKDQTWYTGKLLMDILNYKDMDNLKKYASKCVLIKKEDKFILQSLGFLKRTLAEIDMAFPIVHGKNVEDGSLAGYFETLGIPYVGSNILGSAIGQDKVIMKQIMESENIPVVPYLWFYDIDYEMDKNNILKDINDLGYPVIVKPASLGSSIGISKVETATDIERAIHEATTYDRKVIIEKFIDNLIEVNCSVLGDYTHQEVSTLEQVLKADEILSYKDKYLGNSKSKGMAATNRIIPADIKFALNDTVKQHAKKMFKVFGLSGVCRIDFLIDGKKDKVYVNEPNTIPGSLSYYLWEASGRPYAELLDEMITIGIREFKNNKKKTTSFESNILENHNTNKTKGKLGKM